MIGLALTAALWNSAAALSGGRRSVLPVPGPAGAAAADRWQGVASCAAAACHHGNGLRGSIGSEYTTWANYDPHARAYAALLLERSRTIVKNLGRGKPAHQDSLCLNCHAQPEFDKQIRSTRFTVEDGVGCESCHGAAERWRTAHYSDPAWKNLSIAEKAARGMRDTKTVLGRARVCVDCHVGAPGMDVNHDLIAAGHPRLNFEFAAYHATLPHHWSDAKDKRARPDFEAQAWAIGQVVSAQAALRLLEYRAAKGVWPEFAEYDCYACHHDLKEPSWQQQRGYGERKPGSYPWGSWYQVMVPRALAAEGGDARNFSSALDGLRRAMERPGPSKGEAVTKSRAAADSLDRVLERYGKPLPVAALFRTVAEEDGRDAGTSWDRATQYYLALAALHNAWADTKRPPPPAAVRPALRELAGLLAFPQGFDSPRDFRPAKVRANVDRIRQTLK
jgi:hypothetical protein